MIEPKTLQKLQNASIEDRIAIIEILLQSLKAEVTQNSAAQKDTKTERKRPGFGSMAGTGRILGDIVAPTSTPDSAKVPKFGSVKGLIKMSDDFDEPLEDFAEYVS
ncbi:MAG: DUF2281 domain-containing protein [Cyanobacteria bacterium P01_D01_bin.115]